MDREIIEKLEPYQSFANAEEMLSAVDWYIRHHSLTESALRVLRFLAGRSKAVPGASWLKVETIAKSELVSVSTRTVQRSIRRLEKLGILKVYQQMRDVLGGCGANVYVIQPVTTDVMAKMSGRCDGENPEITGNKPRSREPKKVFFKEASNKDIRTKRTEDVTPLDDPGMILDKSFTSHCVPDEFRDLVGRYFNDAVMISELWRRAVFACHQYCTAPQVPTDIPIEAFKQTVLAYKRRKIRGSFNGYYWGVLAQMFSHYERRRAANGTDLFATQT